MKTGIDSYCYHRFFGEIYPGIESVPDRKMELVEFLHKAKNFGVEAVSIESFMLPNNSFSAASKLGEQLQNLDLECVWAWGHPKGLGSGTRPEALDDLKHHVDLAALAGAKVMRICAGGRGTRTLAWSEHKALLIPLLSDAVDYALCRGIELAIENHIDFLADELLELLAVLQGSGAGVCLDTANNLRMGENANDVVRKLAPFAKAVHLKDIRVLPGGRSGIASFPSVPLGEGEIDIPYALATLAATGFKGVLAIEIDYLHEDFGTEDVALKISVDYLKGALARMQIQ